MSLNVPTESPQGIDLTQAEWQSISQTAAALSTQCRAHAVSPPLLPQKGGDVMQTDAGKGSAASVTLSPQCTGAQGPLIALYSHVHHNLKVDTVLHRQAMQIS